MGKHPRLGTKAKVLIESKNELTGYIKRAYDFCVAHSREKERFCATRSIGSAAFGDSEKCMLQGDRRKK